jgi:hypothetical protein
MMISTGIEVCRIRGGYYSILNLEWYESKTGVKKDSSNNISSLCRREKTGYVCGGRTNTDFWKMEIMLDI